MSDVVKVVIPAKAEHLLVVRLATSGVCSRLGMGIEQMEDAKAAAAEACLIMINDKAGYNSLEVAFEYGDGLWVTVKGQGTGGSQNTDDIDTDFSLALLQALTDGMALEQGMVKFQFAGGAAK
jgi:hypothetical protein